MAEQNTIEMTRKALVALGYPDPAECLHCDKNGLAVYAQDDYKNNVELKKLLKHSSKCAAGASEKLWSDAADYGKPEFIIISNKSNLAVVIECKKAQKSNNLISPKLRDDKILMKRNDAIGKYAVDGALHYAKFLSKQYDVIAIGITGVLNSDELNVVTYFWKHDQAIQYGNNEKGDYCYGPFYDFDLNKIYSYEYYKSFVKAESQGIIREINEEKASISATELNEVFDAAGVNATVRALLVSGLLLALGDKTFQRTYSDKEIISSELLENLSKAIDRVINAGDVSDEYKKKVLRDKFTDVLNQQDLLKDNASQLRIILSKLHDTIYPCITSNFSIDIIGKFYHEFLKYAKNGNNNGIKLTPSFITELFCDLIDIKPNDIVIDPCLGTGGFLVAAMNKMYAEAEKMSSRQIDEFFNDLLKDNKIDERTIQKYKDLNRTDYHDKEGQLTVQDVKNYIKKNQLCGCEFDPMMYALGCSNMILRNDGKSNILHGDCMGLKKELARFKATAGMMNPPYSETKYNIMEFVINLCECVEPKSKVVVIVPTSCAHSDDYITYRNRLLQHNTLCGVMSMNLDLFKGIAGTVTCVMIFETGKSHDYSKPVYWGNWKDDGFIWHKKLGRIPDKNHNVYPKLPNEYKKEWLASYRNYCVDDQYGIWRKLKHKNGECNDEWLWEYFVETDYTKLTQKEFEDVVKRYMLFQLHGLEITYEDSAYEHR